MLMAWLLREGEVLASCTAASAHPFARIPIGELVGSQLLPAQRLCFSGAKGIDVATLDTNHVVLKSSSVRRFRPLFTTSAAVTIVVAERGAFSRWNLAVGDRLEIR